MKLGKNIHIVILLGIGLFFTNQTQGGNALSSQKQKKEKKEHKEIRLTEQQKLEFDYAFAEAIKAHMQGNVDKAISWYASCIKIDPGSAVARYELANIYIEEEDYNSALELAREAVILEPQNIWYEIQLAKIYQKKGMIDQACGVYNDLIEYYPDRNDFYYIQAALYASVEKRKEAIAVYNRLEKEIGITENVSLEKERLYIAMDEKKMAYSELQKLIKVFPHRADLYGLLADRYLADNQNEKAFGIYEKILKIDPNNGLVHFYLADYYWKKKDNDKAYDELRIAFENPEVEIDYKLQYLLSILIDPEQYNISKERLKNLLDQLLAIDFDNVRTHALYADFLRKNKQNEKARVHLRKVIELEKGNYVVWEELLLTSNELLDFESMYSESLEGLKYFPEQPMLYLFNGVASIQLKKFNKATESLKTGLDYIGENIPLKIQFLSYLGEAYYQLENAEEAFNAFEEVLLFDQNNVMILNNYSYYLSLRGEQLDKAEAMSSRCVELEENNSTYLDTYAWVLYMSGRYSEAKLMMEKALENGGRESAVIIEHYGDILYQLGEKDKALKEWEKAKDMGGDSEELTQKVKTGEISQKKEGEDEQ